MPDQTSMDREFDGALSSLASPLSIYSISLLFSSSSSFIFYICILLHQEQSLLLFSVLNHTISESYFDRLRYLNFCCSCLISQFLLHHIYSECLPSILTPEAAGPFLHSSLLVPWLPLLHLLLIAPAIFSVAILRRHILTGRASGINVTHACLGLLLLAHSLANTRPCRLPPVPRQSVALNKEHFLSVVSLVLPLLNPRKTTMVLGRLGLPNILSLVSSTKTTGSPGPPLLKFLNPPKITVMPVR